MENKNDRVNEKKVLEVREREEIIKISKAISKTRYKILKIIANGGKSIREIANKLNFKEPNISAHIKTLKEAGLVKIYYRPGTHGVMSICTGIYDEIIFNIDSSLDDES